MDNNRTFIVRIGRLRRRGVGLCVCLGSGHLRRLGEAGDVFNGSDAAD